MAYEVKLYRQFAKKQNSTAQPATTPKIFSCKIKDGSGILSPTILLDWRGETLTHPTQYNYAYITQFNRYYRVSDIRYISGLWEFDLIVDVLATWKSSIGSYSGYVLRSSYANTGTIKDTFYPSKTNPTHKVKVIGLSWADELSNGRYVVGVVSGGNSNAGSVSYYVMTTTEFNLFCNAVFNNTNDWMDTVNITDISEELLKTLFNPMEYIVSVNWFPFTVPNDGSGSLSSIPLGWWNVPASAYRLYSEAIVTFQYTVTPDAHPQAATRGAYLNSAPYTTLSLDFQPFGFIPLDASIVCGDTITLNVSVDYITGAACLQITIDGGGNNATVLYAAATQVGIPIQISGRQPSIASMVASGISVAADQLPQQSGLLGDIAHVADSFISGITGRDSIAADVSNIASSAATGLKRMASVGSNGSRAQIMENAYLSQDYLLLTDENNAEFGRPLYETRQISTIPGYIQMGDSNISIAGLPDEVTAVCAFLRNGFFYE